ncbi:hypothetical protein [Micromonospora sp. NPDC050200]|uniref:hypothetical protein n=1 Tax=Micromonospora sp. NPDC050200 TaxID=3155664 RepID=UPI003408DA77
MTDLDQRIASTLRERAEGAVDTDRLTARAVTVGRTRRRRRRTGTGVALGLVAALGFGATTVPELPRQLPRTHAGPSTAPVVPPREPGAPGAAARPDLVGADPGVLHFGIDPARARYLGWEAGRGVESVRLDLGGDRQVVVDLARTAADVEQAFHDGMSYSPEPAGATGFDGQIRRVPPSGPGGQPGWILRWRPGPGLYARVTTVAPDDRDLRTAVAALRLDEAYRCAAPLRLTALPAGARLGRCAVTVINFPDSLDVQFTVLGSKEERLDVRLEYRSEIAGSRTEGNRTIGGRPAYRYPRGDKLELLGIPKAHLTVWFGWPHQGFTEADAATVLAGVDLATDLTRPDTWE